MRRDEGAYPQRSVTEEQSRSAGSAAPIAATLWASAACAAGYLISPWIGTAWIEAKKARSRALPQSVGIRSGSKGFNGVRSEPNAAAAEGFENTVG